MRDLHWEDAWPWQYADWLTQRTGEESRLLSEAEWEYVAGTTSSGFGDASKSMGWKCGILEYSTKRRVGCPQKQNRPQCRRHRPRRQPSARYSRIRLRFSRIHRTVDGHR